MSFLKNVKAFLRDKSSYLEELSLQHSDLVQEKAAEIEGDIIRLKNEASAEIKNLARNASYNSEESINNLNVALSKAARSIKGEADELSKRAAELAKDRVAGRYLSVNILSREDELIARRGEMITYNLIKRAEEAGRLQQVLRNTSRAPLESSSPEAQGKDSLKKSIRTKVAGSRKKIAKALQNEENMQ